MDADYAVASKEAAAPEASAYEDGFGMTEGYDSAGNAQDTSTTVPEETAATADRKLIKTVNMDVETREYDKLLSAVENKDNRARRLSLKVWMPITAVHIIVIVLQGMPI